MSQGAAARNLIVGMVFLGSLVLLGISTYAVQGLSFLDDSRSVKVRFETVDNLSVGDAVLVNGFRIGIVDSLTYDPAGDVAPILVECRLRQPVDLRKDATFSIRDSGPLGGRYVAILPGKGEAVDTSYGGFRGATPGGLFAQLEGLVEKNEPVISEILESIRTVLKDIEGRKGVVGTLINDPELRNSLVNGVEEITKTFRAITNGDGTLGALVTDAEMRDRFKKTVEDITEVVASLREEKGIAGYLLNSTEGKENLAKTIADLRSTMSAVRERDGVISKLLHDEELGARVSDTIASIQTILKNVADGKGTLGKILTNDQAWNELVRILVLARETVEDLREQAPISTFVNALFATF